MLQYRTVVHASALFLIYGLNFRCAAALLTFTLYGGYMGAASDAQRGQRALNLLYRMCAVPT